MLVHGCHAHTNANPSSSTSIQDKWTLPYLGVEISKNLHDCMCHIYRSNAIRRTISWGWKILMLYIWDPIIKQTQIVNGQKLQDLYPVTTTDRPASHQWFKLVRSLSKIVVLESWSQPFAKKPMNRSHTTSIDKITLKGSNNILGVYMKSSYEIRNFIKDCLKHSLYP